MDPNQNNLFYNFMCNYQNPANPSFQNPANYQNPANPNFQNPANFQSPANPPYQFPMFQPPPTNTPFDQGTSMSTSTEQKTTPEIQTPSFSTQVGLENIVLDEEQPTQRTQGKNKEKTARERFTQEEDKIVIQSWLNISKDAVVGVDQRASSFWKRITDNYNEYRGRLKERELNQIKCRWSKLNKMVSKFAACYKQAYSRKKSGSSEDDIIDDALAMYAQDVGRPFLLVFAWKLLKNEPKWSSQIIEGTQIIEEYNKRTKNSVSGAYTSSSNPDTPTSGDCGHYNSSESKVVRPIGTKAAKRKGKSKANETPSVHIDLTRMEDAQQSKALALEEIARGVHEGNKLKEKELQIKEKNDELQYLFKDTIKMTEEQLQAHKVLCKIIREKYELV